MRAFSFIQWTVINDPADLAVLSSTLNEAVIFADQGSEPMILIPNLDPNKFAWLIVLIEDPD